ncbi:MAG: T9SS type A sorting domain-containing protein [Tenuifilaceae bacterium]
MKDIKKILIFLILSIWGINSFAQVILSEGFEGTTSLHVPPTNWIPDSNDDFWYFQNGGWDQFTGYHHPANARTGNFNAMFKTFGNATSKLVLPSIDLRFSIKPVLTFWNAQELRAGINDKLKVFYRTTPTSSWVEMESYINPTAGWVKREIILPDAAKTQTCQLAFEGTSQNLSWGVCIDDVVLEEKGNLPRQVESLSLLQNNYIIPSNSNTNPLGIISINISGNTGDQTLKSVSIDYSGTDINDININGSEIFYTRDTIFSPNNKITPTISNTGNIITFSSLNYNLQTGDNFIWICSSIKSSATHNNIADFKLLQNSINISDVLFPGGAIEPIGASTIEESIFFDGFESSSGWQISPDPGSTWQIGIPQGTGTYDPNFSFSGQKVMATNLSGNYPAGIRPINPHTITSPTINAKYYQNLNLRFKRWLNFEYFDKTYIQCSVDGGSTWVNLWGNNTTVQDQNWKSLGINISTLATRKQDVKIRFSIDSTDLTGPYGGWNIDNFAVTGDFIAKDVGVSGITSPVTHCGMTTTEAVTVKIKNYGGAIMTTPFEVGFSIDNGVTYTKELISPTIAVDGEYTYTFTATANLASPGLKYLKFKTYLTGDEDTKNDLFSTTLYVFPTVNYNYASSFETTNGFWNPSGTNSTWAWGIPAAAVINKASNGTKAWVTSLKSNYSNSEVSNLESPCINFTGSEYPVFSFDFWVNAENGIDGFRLDYSIDGGTAWNPVPANANHTLNWCTGTAVTALGTDGWTGIVSTGYVTARTLLPSDVVNKTSVKFRFYFATDGANTFEGVSIDNIKIYELPYDVGVESLTTPVSACLIGNDQTLTASVKNIGYRPLKVGLKVPIEIKLRTETVVKDTLVIATQVNQTESASFSTTDTYDIFTKGAHALRLNTNFQQELNRANDTLKTTLEVWGTPGFTLGADKAVPAPEPISVLLDAGAGYDSYLWSTAATTQTITAILFGTYDVDVETNTDGHNCIATDEIQVIESSNDITITASTGLADACSYPTPVFPQITIKNNGPSIVGPSHTMTSIPISVMVDGVVKANETYTPATDIASGESANYTFTTSLDISEAKTYDIRFYSKINEDPDKNNDTLKVTTNVWGLPDVSFPYDTIVSFQADTLILDAGAGFNTYLWQDNTTNTQTFDVSSINSASYIVTVTDIHSCGSDKDTVYVNAKDISVDRIDSPSTAFCDNETSHVKILIRNSGKDNITAGSTVSVNYITPNESITQNFTVPLLTPEATTSLEFGNQVNLPLGTGFIKVTASIINDSNHENNVLEKSFEKLSGPSVYFNPSTLYKVFGSDPYVVSPNYSIDVKSFIWKNISLTDISYDSLYTIVGNPPSKLLHVIAFDKESNLGCRDTATLSIIAEDIAVDAIKSPTNQCVFGNNIPITVTIANKGNFAYPAGTVFVVGINVDGTPYANENITLSTSLDPNGKMDVTLNPILNLTGKSSSNIQISISATLDAVTNNNVLNKTVYATGYPTISLGVDKTIHAWSDTLRAGDNFNLYAWKYNNTSIPAPEGVDSIYAATQTGTYNVTVTDFNGCSTSDEIVLTFVVDDISLKTLNKPITGCGLKDTETVQVTVENTGTEIIPLGKQIELGFNQNGVKKTENFTLTSNLAVSQTLNIDLTSTMDFTTKKLYPIETWVRMVGDMRENNDTLSTSIDAYPPAFFSFGSDTIRPKGADTTLNAGSGYATYLWSTGATTSSINIVSTNDYWVVVTNSSGCSDRDTVYVKIGTIDVSVKSITAPVSACSLSATETITIKIKNSGVYNSLPIGTVIPLVLKVNSVSVASENFTLTSALPAGDSIAYSFTYKHNFATPATYNIEVTANMANDEVLSNNTKQKTISVYGNPTPNLGADRVITAATILDAGPGYTTYTWQDNSHNQTFTASATGKYSVTVIDANGCQGYDEVNITWQEVSDVRVSQLITPSTSCFNSIGQTVTAQLTNMGTKTFTSSENINVSYQIGTATPVVETLNFTSNFANGQTLNYTFTQKALLNPGAVTFYLKTIVAGNDGQTLTVPVTINALPALNLGPDTIRTQLPYVLTSGISGVTYLWNTGSTNASISVATWGKYKLTVTSTTTGCTAKDSVIIHWPVSVETISGSNTKVYLYPNPVNDILKIKIESEKAAFYIIELVSPQGQLMQNLKTEKVSYFEGEMNVNNYSPGIYIVRVNEGKGSATFKVVVQ